MSAAAAHAPHAITARRGGRVVLDGAEIVMLGSNDYLGLSMDPRVLAATSQALEEYGTGTGLYPVFASTPLHDALCAELAAFLGVEAVALFSSGGSANTGVLTTLVGEGDAILSDRLNHASIVDGCRLSRAEVVTYANRSLDDLEAALERTEAFGRRLVITDGIFSMEGGAAPLRGIYELARKHGAMLVIDEAHALGVVGPRGTGTAPLLGLSNGTPGLVLTGSLSKAIGGASGGFVAGPRMTIERLQRECRSWIFTMGMTTANVATALAALRVHRDDDSLLDRLWANVHHLRRRLGTYGLPFLDSDSAITAVLVGDEDAARHASQNLPGRGAYAPAMTHPIVARGQARLWLQVSARHSEADLDLAAEALRTLLRERRDGSL